MRFWLVSLGSVMSIPFVSDCDHDHQRGVSVLKAPEGDGEGYLIIEDLVDSGDTARKLRSMYPKAKLIAVVQSLLVSNYLMTTLSILRKILGLSNLGIWRFNISSRLTANKNNGLLRCHPSNLKMLSSAKYCLTGKAKI